MRAASDGNGGDTGSSCGRRKKSSPPCSATGRHSSPKTENPRSASAQGTRRENKRLKQLLVAAELDKAILKEALKGN
jgi:hypothetical protein